MKKASVAYSKEKGFELKIDGQTISNTVIADPAVVVIGSEGAKLQVEIMVDIVEMDDLGIDMTVTRQTPEKTLE